MCVSVFAVRFCVGWLREKQERPKSTSGGEKKFVDFTTFVLPTFHRVFPAPNPET
jgi:hypothetical protein